MGAAGRGVDEEETDRCDSEVGWRDGCRYFELLPTGTTELLIVVLLLHVNNGGWNWPVLLDSLSLFLLLGHRRQ